MFADRSVSLVFYPQPARRHSERSCAASDAPGRHPSWGARTRKSPPSLTGLPDLLRCCRSRSGCRRRRCRSRGRRGRRCRCRRCGRRRCRRRGCRRRRCCRRLCRGRLGGRCCGWRCARARPVRPSQRQNDDDGCQADPHGPGRVADWRRPVEIICHA